MADATAECKFINMAAERPVTIHEGEVAEGEVKGEIKGEVTEARLEDVAKDVREIRMMVEFLLRRERIGETMSEIATGGWRGWSGRGARRKTRRARRPWTRW